MANTYEPIATTTLGSAAASITFSSIPNTYTDLKLIVKLLPTGALRPRLEFNSDAGTNYCALLFTGAGDGGIASMNLYTATNYINVTNGSPGNYPVFIEIDIQSYANSTYKTTLCKYYYDSTTGGRISYGTGTWLSTSAISTIRLFASTLTFEPSSTATLYGILKA